MKLFFLLILISFLGLKPNNSSAQNEVLLPWLTDSFEFAIACESAQYDFEKETMTPGKNIFYMKLTSSQMQDMKKLTFEEWENLLNEEERSYLITVLLNHIYERDISPSYLIRQRKEWFDNKSNQEKELMYWLSFLKHNMPISFPYYQP